MYNLIMARRNTLLLWAGIEASLAAWVWNANRKPLYGSFVRRNKQLLTQTNRSLSLALNTRNKSMVL
ncbi:hypothetical protein B0H12DRAFT_1125512 [Mycena haematopus]|nr:hypothetical protein B0H12DRAFT_1125512 [Mycena haematopus]